MPSTPRLFASMTCSDFTRDGHANLEAVILTGNELRHWFRDTGNEPRWRPAQVIATNATSPGCIIVSSFRRDEHRNFEVVVPLANDHGGSDLWHFFHDNADPALPWQRLKMVAADVLGPASMIQSDFTHDGDAGNFEVVVPVRNAFGGADLRHFFHDNSDLDSEWVPLQVVAANVAGPGCLVQSDQGDGDHGNFEVVVPHPNGAGGMDLWHHFHDNSDLESGWVQAQLVVANVAGPGCLIVSDFTHDGKDNNFEVVVPLTKGNGLQLRHYFHENDDLTSPWHRGQMITDSCSGWATIVQGDFGDGPHGNFEVLVPECSSSIVSYRHVNSDTSLPWFRQDVVIGEAPPVALVKPDRVCQLTGQWDRTGWNGEGDSRPAFNTTEDQFGIRGTDLGSSFVHKGTTWFLFGDTWRTTDEFDTNLDSVAFASGPLTSDGLPLHFLPRPPVVRGGGVGQHELEIPLDGVSDGETMYVFFATDHRNIEGYELMGRSALARSADGMDFEYLWSLSTDRFVNVSLARGQVSGSLAAEFGWARGTTDALWIWGSGRYRSSDVYLAVIPFGALRRTTPDGKAPTGTRFFSGRHGAPAWSPVEEDSTALFFNASVGELCVRWNPHLSRWLATFNSDNPRGILLHWATDPWGPWSEEPLKLLDAGDAYNDYMHASWAHGGTDHTQDDIIPNRIGGNDDGWGGEYGGYQVGNLATDENQGSRIWWLLSTWNPYQVMLMSSHVPVAQVSAPKSRIRVSDRAQLKTRRHLP